MGGVVNKGSQVNSQQAAKKSDPKAGTYVQIVCNHGGELRAHTAPIDPSISVLEFVRHLEMNIVKEHIFELTTADNIRYRLFYVGNLLIEGQDIRFYSCCPESEGCERAECVFERKFEH